VEEKFQKKTRKKQYLPDSYEIWNQQPVLYYEKIEKLLVHITLQRSMAVNVQQ